MFANALVVFDSRHGNTAKIAAAVARGLSSVEGVHAESRYYHEVQIYHLEAADLIAIGGPTESFAESHNLKKFFDHIGAYDLHGKFGFAFDTHGPSPLSGSAARTIEKQMRDEGISMLEPRHSAITHRVGHVHASIQLTESAEAEFEKLGKSLGESLVARMTDRKAAQVPAPKA